MTKNRLLLTFLILPTIVIGIFAGNGINSPYSRYGLGILSDQNLGVNRQMGGLGYALRSNSYINLLNPASFSEADTLTMLFESGFSMQNVNFKEGNVRRNARNASFDYIAMQFRATKGVGITFGFLPYSNVGYSFATTENESGKELTSSYNGEGGVYQPFVGVGWTPAKNLSVGFMASYIYGDISHSISNVFSESSIDNMVRQYNVEISSYKLDFGVQYAKKITDKQHLTLGAVYSIGHNLNADAVEIKTTTDSDTTTLNGAFRLPTTIGIGVVYGYNNKWKFGLDYSYQNWGKASFFGYDKGVNRSKISAGIEYSPGNTLSRNIFKKMNYRAGAYYAQPYTEVDGKQGCEEYGASIGFSLPVINRINNRSTLHVSGQIIRLEPKSPGLITETYLRLNIGITFNESWFMKMKLR